MHIWYKRGLKKRKPSGEKIQRKIKETWEWLDGHNKDDVESVYMICVCLFCVFVIVAQCMWLSTQQWTIQHDSLSWLVSDWLGTCWDISISGSSLPQITTTRRRKMIYGGELRHHGRYVGDNSFWAFRIY